MFLCKGALKDYDPCIVAFKTENLKFLMCIVLVLFNSVMVPLGYSVKVPTYFSCMF